MSEELLFGRARGDGLARDVAEEEGTVGPIDLDIDVFISLSDERLVNYRRLVFAVSVFGRGCRLGRRCADGSPVVSFPAFLVCRDFCVLNQLLEVSGLKIVMFIPPLALALLSLGTRRLFGLWYDIRYIFCAAR